MNKLHALSRTEILLGKKAIQDLSHYRIAVFGIGGVGSYVVEALIRCGIQKLLLVDDDLVCLTNLNRQLHATRETIGQPKVQVMKQRILSISPEAEVQTKQVFVTPTNIEEIISSDLDYIVDAIDSMASKVALIVHAQEKNIPIISCLGTANKLDPTQFKVADLYDTKVCPLARILRHDLRQKNIRHLKVVYSEETPLKLINQKHYCPKDCTCVHKNEPSRSQRQIPGTVSFVPPVAGLITAGEVIKDLLHLTD